MLTKFNNALYPEIVGPGLQIQVLQGTVLINGSEATFPTTIVGLSANTTTWVFINISAVAIQTNNSGFPLDSFPIAIATTTNSGVSALLDSRPDYVIQGANSGINGRFVLNFGTNLVTGNFVLTGWGSGASMSLLAGKDSAHVFVITAGSGASVDPTVQLTFADGAWNSAPLIFAQVNKGTGSIFPITSTSTQTTYTMTFWGLPLNTLTYGASVLVCGLS